MSANQAFRTHVRRADQLIGLRRYTEGEREARAAVAVDPGQAEGWLHLGLALHRQGGRGEEALDVVGKALAHEPESAWAHRLRSGILTQLGRHDEALAAAEGALQITPEHPYAHHRYGACLSNLGRHREAIEALDKALSFDPEDASVYDTKCRVLLELGWLYQAVEAAETAVKLDPEAAYLLERLGDCHDRLGEREEAVRAFHRAVKMDPTSGYAKRRLREVADGPRRKWHVDMFALWFLVGVALCALIPFIGWWVLVLIGGWTLFIGNKAGERLKADDQKWEAASPGAAGTLNTLRKQKKRSG